VNRNDYPREALLEAVLRYIEEDLGPGGPSSPVHAALEGDSVRGHGVPSGKE
jgi:hypothetical protein